ncbi:MAG TPA: tetratricopeptide repeat protein, partial [Vicinamibacteria bacterium]
MHALLFALLASQAPPPPSSSLPSVARDRAEAYYHFSLGLQARFSGDTQTSLEEYRKAARLDSGSAAIRVEMARLLREERKYDEAESAAQEAVRLDRDNADAHLILAQLYQRRSESTQGEDGLKKAAAEYEQVVRLTPGDLNTLQTLAILYGQLREHKDAARVWQLYLALDPGSFDGLLQLGSHQLAAGEPERAAASLKQALEL